MAFIMVRIECGSVSVNDMNSKVKDSANPHAGVVQLRDLLDGILAGTTDGEVDVAVRDSSQAITAAGGGSTASYNLK